MAAMRTVINMATECCCAAAGDRSQHAESLDSKPGSILFHETVALCMEDIGQLHGRPAHSGLCSFLDRFKFAGPETGICSMGLTPICRCLGETCRYRTVASMSLWPMRTWVVLRSVPPSSRCEAKQWRSVCGVTLFCDSGTFGSFLHGFPDDLWRNRFIRSPAVFSTGRQVGLRSHPAPVCS